LSDDANRRHLFNNHSVFLADDGYFDPASIAAMDALYTDLPAHLMDNGVLGAGTAFCTVTCRDAFACGADGALQYQLVVFTKTGYNLFQEQLGDRTENAFGGTTVGPAWAPTPDADGLMSAMRHETAHQFDRTMSSVAVALKNAIKSRCTVDENWLRAGVARFAQGANAFFQENPVEIVASQLGNQWLSSTSTQLEVSRYRADAEGDLLPMEWLLLNAIIVGDETSTTFYERSSQGFTAAIPVGLDRAYAGGPATQLRVPGCGYFDFAYDASGHLSGYAYAPGFGETDPSSPCVPDTDGTAFPTVVPTTASPTGTPTIAPTSCSGVQSVKGNNKGDLVCEVDLDQRLAFACCTTGAYAADPDQCTRMHPMGTIADEEGTETYPFENFRAVSGSTNKNGYCVAGKTDNAKGASPFPDGCPPGSPSSCVDRFVGATHGEAKTYCTSLGLKLCDVIDDDSSDTAANESPNCKTAKCNYDNKRMWTDIACAVSYGPCKS
jgi:hypothetical protein